MSATKTPRDGTRSNAIRSILNKDFNMPALEVQTILAAKGIHCSDGLIHVVRSAMRKERKERVMTRLNGHSPAPVAKPAPVAQVTPPPPLATVPPMAADPPKPKKAKKKKAPVKPVKKTHQSLRELVLSVLKKNPGMTVAAIAKAVVERGYVAKSQIFGHNVQKVLNALVNDGLAYKDSNTFYLQKTHSETNGIAAHSETNGIAAHSETNGIAALVVSLKEILAKFGKKQVKELVEVL